MITFPHVSARTARTFAVVLTVWLSALSAVLTYGAHEASASTGTPATCGHGHVVVYEDDPCWNWTTSGNRSRGVVTLYGNEIVVGPCTFARLWYTGHLAYTVTLHGRTYRTLDRMRGDQSARAAYRAGACFHGNVQDYAL